MIEINQLYIHSNATLTLQESVRILVNEFNNYGTCIACDRAVKIKGLDFSLLVKIINQVESKLPHTVIKSSFLG